MFSTFFPIPNRTPPLKDLFISIGLGALVILLMVYPPTENMWWGIFGFCLCLCLVFFLLYRYHTHNMVSRPRVQSPSPFPIQRDALVVREYRKGDVFLREDVTDLPLNRMFGLEPYFMVETHICDPLGGYVWDYDDTDRASFMLVLFDRSISRVVGVAAFNKREDLNTVDSVGGILMLDAFCIYQEYRGKGVAASFLEEAMSQAAARFTQSDKLYLIATNLGVKLYTHMGFEPIPPDYNWAQESKDEWLELSDHVDTAPDLTAIMKTDLNRFRSVAEREGR